MIRSYNYRNPVTDVEQDIWYVEFAPGAHFEMQGIAIRR